MTPLQRYLMTDCRPITLQAFEVEMLSFTLGRWRQHLAEQPTRPDIVQKIEAIDALVVRLHETLPPKEAYVHA